MIKKALYIIAIIALLVLCFFAYETISSISISKKGPMAKFCFFDRNGNMVKNAKINTIYHVYPSETINQDVVQKGEINSGHGEKYEFKIRDVVNNARMFFTCPGSPDFAVVESADYWEVSPELKFDYYLAVNFRIDGSSEPTEEEMLQRKASQFSKNPSIKILDINGNEITNAARGQILVIDASDFQLSKNIELFLNGKKIGKSRIVYKNFGLRIKAPILSTSFKAKIVGDGNEEAETNIKVTF